jgi:hypothetical protein
MRMPLLQKGIPMTANLPLQRTQLMLRHPTDGGNRAVAQPELRFLPTFPRVHMRRLARISAVK